MTAGKLTQAQVYERIAAMPPGELRERTIQEWKMYYGGRSSEDTGAVRVVDDRRKFFGDIWKYARDVFGYKLYPDLERLLEACMTHTRVLAPAANDLGKTFAITLWATYRYDVVGAMPDVEAGLEQQGCLVLLPGPTEQAVFATTYYGMLKHFERAVRRGHGMPGTWSNAAINMRAGPDWYVEAITPSRKAGEEIAHAASGRHHRSNLIVVIEEGQAVREPIWLAMDGSASGANDTIVSPFNPDIPVGPARERAESGGWHVVNMSAMDHPNVIQRKVVIPGAISHGRIDDSIRDQCKDLGPSTKRAPDPKHHDFIYSLPPRTGGHADPWPRSDGILGHADGEPRVYRPNAMFTAQRLGRWPLGASALLFSPEMLQESAARYDQGLDPEEPPAAVGLDPAQYGDDATATPRWGGPADELLERYHEAAREGAAAAEAFRADPANRIRVGDVRVMPKGDAFALANAVLEEFPESPFVVDQGGGEGVISELRNNHDRDVHEVPFGGEPWEPVRGERPGVDMRACIYIRSSELLALGLLDAPMPVKLKKDLLAHHVAEVVYRFAEVETAAGWQRIKRACVRLVKKDKIKIVNGRSPDYGDSFCLSIVEPTATGRHIGPAMTMVTRT